MYAWLKDKRDYPEITSEEHSKWKLQFIGVIVDGLVPLIKTMETSYPLLHNQEHISKLNTLLRNEERGLHIRLMAARFTAMLHTISLWHLFMKIYELWEELYEKLTKLTAKMWFLQDTFKDNVGNSLEGFMNSAIDLLSDRLLEFKVARLNAIVFANELSEYLLNCPV